eukprot:TRINITY_DN3788_c0_g1_i1.p1 TRINITY_DN3788_c0_g1~~TRINITY_DN3788_c0_g1_i1.p1  ORF type:complete len:189 (-),score=35.24 TRINITY_DN3788_c0_g1_i1:206-772(-)
MCIRDSHGAEANTTACGTHGDDSSVPAFVAQAHKTIQACELAGKGTADFCSASCQDAFANYITYGDTNICWELTSGAEATYYPETRSEMNTESDTAGCHRTGGGCTSTADCNHRGQCVYPVAPATDNYCLCDFGWNGLYCGTNYSCPGDCTAPSHGVCFPDTAGGESTGACHCYGPWTGDDCSKRVDH